MDDLSLHDFQCIYCDKKYCSSSSLRSHVFKKHKESHHEAVSAQKADYLLCPVGTCSASERPTFKTQATLKNHIRVKHSQQLSNSSIEPSNALHHSFECPKCQVKKLHAMELVSHMRDVCSIEVDEISLSFHSQSDFASFKDKLPFEQFRLVERKPTKNGVGVREVFECRRSRNRQSDRTSSSKGIRIRHRNSVSMNKKCISRMFVYEPVLGGSVRVEWIQTHLYHDPSDGKELSFRSLPQWLQRNLFSQFQAGISEEQIIKNCRSDFVQNLTNESGDVSSLRFCSH